MPLDQFLQVSIVTNVNAQRPFDYRVFVAPAWRLPGSEDADLVTDKVRIHEMNPESDENLRRFCEDYEAAGDAFLGVAVLPTGAIRAEDVRHIGNRPTSAIRIRSATTLGPDDWEAKLLSLGN